MYLPAIPSIAAQWAVEKSVVNLSLVLWFAAYGIALLVWGSVSDRIGRRPVLLSGLAGFVISSVFCVMSQNVYQLMIARIIQGTAAAGSSSMVMAIARDRYQGKQRQLVLAWIGIILGITPMLAPSIGAAVLKYLQWRYIFAIQGVLASASLAMALLVYTETAETLDKGGLGSILKRYGRLSKNTNYMLINGTTGLLTAPFFGFIAFSSAAYIVYFGMTEQQFGILFGMNALCAVMGSLVCTRLIKYYNEYRLITIDYIGCLAGSLILLCLGHLHWFLFTAGMGVFSFFFGMSRPLVNHLILEQVQQDIGAASSGIVCYQFIAGAVGMAITTREWSHPFAVFGVMAALCAVIVLMIWPFLLKRVCPSAVHCGITAESREDEIEEMSGG